LGPPPPPKLQQDTYKFTLMDKIRSKERIVERTGHLVVTQHNIVLFNENQEMIWGIPNDGAVIEFEMLPRSKYAEMSDEAFFAFADSSMEGDDFEDEYPEPEPA